MLRYVLYRLLLVVPMLFGVVIIVFSLMHLVPGDPAVVFLGENATPEAVRELHHQLGLDRALPAQLASYARGVLHGDLGRSVFQNEPVVDLVARRLPATLELALAALVVATTVGVFLGVVAALRHGSLLDVATMLFAQLGVSMPVFWLGILLSSSLAVGTGWFPAVGRGEPLVSALGAALAGRPHALIDSLAHLALPALTLGLGNVAVTSRMVRASLLDTLGFDYVRAARAKGLTERKVVLGHALRNALLPVVSVLGVRAGTLLGGSVLTESIFGWPGLGHLAVTAISQRDLPLIQGIVLVFATVFLILNLAIDVGYGVLDPRVRRNEGGASSVVD